METEIVLNQASSNSEGQTPTASNQSGHTEANSLIYSKKDCRNQTDKMPFNNSESESCPKQILKGQLNMLQTLYLSCKKGR